MSIQQAIHQVIEGKDLTKQQMRDAFTKVFSDEATDAQKAGLLIALRMKSETVDEITAAAQVMRELSTKVNVSSKPLIDIVGTGGDGLKTLNVSTASAMVVAAAGGKVAKHGNRAASSQSGSADLLEASGAKIDLNADQVAQCIDTLGIGFMFAPMHHSAMKYAIGVRKELATRTIFNVLGPLTNPANPQRLLLGVYDKKLCYPIAQVLQQLGCEHALVIHGDDGMDEISICTTSTLVELKQNQIQEHQFNPNDYAINYGNIEELMVKDAHHSLQKIQAVFNGEDSSCRDIILLNSGAALYLAGKSETIKEGISLAKEIIKSGKAGEMFSSYAEFSNKL